MNIEEWVINKRKHDFKYCGKCFTDEEVYPFGVCKECWLKEGKPKEVKL